MANAQEMHPSQCDLIIVDDEENFRIIFGKIIQNAIPDMRIEFAADGCEALSKVEALRPRIVWTNLRMPRMNGLELIEAIRKNPNLKETKIIVCTAYGDEKVKREAIELGADVYMYKPIREIDVLSAIARCLFWLAVPSSCRDVETNTPRSQSMDENEQETRGEEANQTEEETATGGGWPEDNSHLPWRPCWGTVSPERFWTEYNKHQGEKNLIDLKEYRRRKKEK